MADEVVLLPEERLESLSDQIIQSIINSDEVSKANRQIVFGQLSPKVFRDENYIIFTVFHHFKDKGITPDADFLEMYLSRNSKLLKDSQGYINLADYKDLDENMYLAYTSAVIKKFKRIV